MSRERSDEIARALTELDADIRHGRGMRARHSLQAMLAKGIPREHRAGAAYLLGRCGLAPEGARLLHALVRPAKGTAVPASSAELAEYAACLVKIGAIAECAEILEDADPETCPRVLLYRAFVLVARWDYRGSIPVLRQYLASPGLTPYDRLVGKTNLAAALVFERDHVRANPLLQQLLHDLSLRKLHLLLGRALELSAESFIAQSRWRQAERFLEEAEKRLGESGAIDLFFVRKFRAVAACLKARASRDTVKALAIVRREAEERNHWETVRDCDRYLATAARDEELLLKVYFGSPFESFRRRLLADLPWKVDVPSEYWHRLSSGKKKERRIDLETGSVDGKEGVLKPGFALHRLLALLASDFYRPFRTTEIFFRIFPGEYYHPDSSKRRVWELIRRFRASLVSSRLPLAVEEHGEGYRLAGTGPVALRLPPEGRAPDTLSIQLDKLAAAWGGRAFSAAEAARALAVHPRAALRLLSDAVQEGKVSRSGRSVATRYEIRKVTRR